MPGRHPKVGESGLCSLEEDGSQGGVIPYKGAWVGERGRSDAQQYCEQLLHRNVQRFRGVVVFKAHRLLYHSTLGLRVIKKKKYGGQTFCVRWPLVLAENAACECKETGGRDESQYLGETGRRESYRKRVSIQKL